MEQEKESAHHSPCPRECAWSAVASLSLTGCAQGITFKPPIEIKLHDQQRLRDESQATAYQFLFIGGGFLLIL